MMESQILGLLNKKATEPSKENAKIVKQFVDGLTQFLMCEKGLLQKSSVMHCGSSYEGLVVKAKSDFDLPLVLSDPFVGNNFKILRDQRTGYFQLQCKSEPPKEIRDYCEGGEGEFLNAKKLQNDIFERLRTISDQVVIPGWTVKVHGGGLTALGIVLQRAHEIINIDLAPQIAVRSWDGCRDLQPLSSLPADLGEHIKTLEKNHSPIFFFSLAVPCTTYFSQRLLNVSFSMLEKNFLQMNTDVRDMVRLMKLVVDRKEWKKKYGVKSFHLKRVAISRYQELKREPTIWDGFKKLAEFMKIDLVDKKYIGCFIKNQQLDTLRNIEAFLKELNDVYPIKQDQLYNFVLIKKC